MADYDSYDVIIAGGGMAGCVLAGRIAERGVNPKTGDRVKVAMVEAGPYWKGEIRPGYGDAQRRQIITNIAHARTDQYLWPYRVTGSGKMVGGSSLHFGSNAWLPGEVDLENWVAETGVDWTWDELKPAVEEAREMFHIQAAPPEALSKGTLLFRDAASALGHAVHPTPMAAQNCLYCGYCGGGYMCRYDSKGTSLVYAHLAEKHGAEIISDAEVERIIIEKQGAKPVARGIVYRKDGQLREARAGKIIISCGVAATPLLLYRSGYGPRELLGNKLIVENGNVGQHMTGDASFSLAALFDEPIKQRQLGASGACHYFLEDAHRDGSFRLRFKDSFDNRIAFPDRVALGEFAPAFGKAHKKYMKDALVRLGGINLGVQNIKSIRGKINPDAQIELEGDSRLVDERWAEGIEMAVEVLKKMGAAKVSQRRPRFRRISHEQGTCRAGDSRESSVVNPYFESHDVENLLIADGSAIPRNTVSLAAGPVMAVACFAWRRIVERHFQ
ncbi:MAG: GMC family oxidoreductase [Acidobacteria bacterium]|nr:GMC family oxidoreductase [Acidobacteriota bacterium]